MLKDMTREEMARSAAGLLACLESKSDEDAYNHCLCIAYALHQMVMKKWCNMRDKFVDSLKE